MVYNFSNLLGLKIWHLESVLQKLWLRCALISMHDDKEGKGTFQWMGSRILLYAHRHSKMILSYVFHFSLGFFRSKRFKGRTRKRVKPDMVCVCFSIALTSSGDSLESVKKERKIRPESLFFITRRFVVVLCITFDKLIPFTHYFFRKS